jgi:hypothetical protein
MKKIWLFLLIIFLMPALGKPQKKCDIEKNFCPIKIEQKSDTTKFSLKSQSVLLYPTINYPADYFDYLILSNPSYPKKFYSRLSLHTIDKSEDSVLVFLRLWGLNGCLTYRYFLGYPYPRGAYFTWGRFIKFNWIR